MGVVQRHGLAPETKRLFDDADFITVSCKINGERIQRGNEVAIDAMGGLRKRLGIHIRTGNEQGPGCGNLRLAGFGIARTRRGGFKIREISFLKGCEQLKHGGIICVQLTNIVDFISRCRGFIFVGVFFVGIAPLGSGISIFAISC